MDGFDLTTDWLWPAALAIIPLSMIAAFVCRWVNLRASTRHAIWLTVLLCLFVPPIVPSDRLVPMTGTDRPVIAKERPAISGLAGRAPRSAGPTGVTSPGPMNLLFSRDPSVAERTSTRLSERAFPRVSRPPSSPRVAPATGSAPAAPAINVCDSTLSATPPLTGLGHLPALQIHVSLPTELPQQRESSFAPLRALSGAAGSLSHMLSSAWAREIEAWRAWLPRMGDVRASIASLPPIPSAVWVAGAGLLGAIALVQLWALRRLMRQAEPAPAQVRQMVEYAARTIGLRRVPETLMVSVRVSPMVTCWGRSRLILPRELWEELDDVGRDAVVLHELAHLKRRDHWVSYAELVAAALFWWHPVVWWVRRRLREEADACCDAWVTTLRPRDRRSYAQALLDTRAYLSRADRRGSGFAAGMGVGLGVTGSGAKRFARRLTMVMKERAKPRLSVYGLALAGMLGLIGAAGTPLLACPPDEKSKDKATEHTRAHEGQHEAEVTAALREAQVAHEHAAKEHEKALKEGQRARAEAQKQREAALKQAAKQRETALKHAQKEREAALKQAAKQRDAALKDAQKQREKALMEAEAQAAQGRRPGAAAGAQPRRAATAPRARASGQGGSQNMDGAQRQMEQLERRLERLEQQLQRLEESLNRGGRPHTMVTPRAPGRASMGVLSVPALAPVPAAPPTPPAPAGAACAATAPCPAAKPCPEGTPAPEAPLTAPAPPAQPAAPLAPTGGITMFEVPLTSPQLATTIAPLVSYAQSGITPYLTMVQQPADSGEEVVRAYPVPEGKREALWDLMAREDVPIFVSQTEDGIQVQGTARQQAIFAAFLNMIHPGAAPDADFGLMGGLTIDQPYPVAMPQFDVTLNTQAGAFEAALADLMARAEALAAQAEELASRAQELEAEGDDLDEQAEQIDSDAEELEGEARAAARARVRELQARARDLRRQASQVESQAESMAEHAEQVQEEIQALEEARAEAEEAAQQDEASDDCDEGCDESCEGCDGDCGDCCDDADEAGDDEGADDDDGEKDDKDGGKIDT